MLLAEVAATSDAVASTRSRLAKRAAIAGLLRQAADDAVHGPTHALGPALDEIEIAVAYLAGELRQRRTGLGWRSLRSLPAPAPEPSLSLDEVDGAFERMAGLSGPGSATARQAEAAALFGAATALEQALLAGLVSGELRQGALDSVVVDAVAEAAGVSVDAVRRAVMLRGATGPVARAALGAPGPDAALAALATFRLEVGRAVRPMLAQSASDVAEAFDKLGVPARADRTGAVPPAGNGDDAERGDVRGAGRDGAEGGDARGAGSGGAAPGVGGTGGAQDEAVPGYDDFLPVAVDVKLDGIRVQVHRDGEDVRVFTRSLDDITARVPEIVAAVRALTVRTLVLDGEALVVGDDGVPRPFQETAARSATREPGDRGDDGPGGPGGPGARLEHSTPAAGPGDPTSGREPTLAAAHDAGLELTPFFFDVLHADGRDLLDEPLRERLAVLDAVAGEHVVRRLVTADAAQAARFFDDAVAQGQEGVVVKSLDAPYAAGRRGAGWVKVKPRHRLDLVVLAVEQGSGRRSGWLSNIWLGARDPDGGFVMLGKTFKGMTDEMLAWQTERFTELETGREGHVVHVRPEQVVEIAFDGLQRSTRYPGGLALRFARVVRYRDDKTAAEADTIDAVRAIARA